MHAFTALTLLVASVAAVPVQLVRRGCNPMPSKVDPAVRDIVYKTVKSRGGNDRVMLATMAGAITESLVNNLNCGDKDSLGVFQQRPSMGWGTPAQLQDPVYATNKFLDGLIPIERKNPGTNAGVLAQMVQLAEAGNQYTKNLDFARQLINEAKASVGDDSTPAPAPSKPSTPINTAPKPPANKPESPADKPQPPADKPTGKPSSDDTDNNDDANCDADGNDTDGNDDEDCDDSDEDDSTPAPSTPINTTPAPPANNGACKVFYTPKQGDNCYKLADMFGLKLAQIYSLNPSIDADCHNLQVNQQYCVDPAAA